MYILQYIISVPNKDRKISPESEEYRQLLETLRKQGKLIDRIVVPKNEHEFDVTWIWDSKESADEFRDHPINQQRMAEVNDYVDRKSLSSEII